MTSSPLDISLFYLMALALLQGITEFLPVSSSAHLFLWGIISGKEQSIDIDIALHFGSFFAVALFCRHDIKALLHAVLARLRGQSHPHDPLLRFVLYGTIPLFCFGALLRYGFAIDSWRSLQYVAIANIVFALFLWCADRYGGTTRNIASLSRKHALMVGLCQSLALLPGVSRSGAVITASRLLHMSRAHALHGSFLLSMPALLGAMSLVFIDMAHDPRALSLSVLITSTAFSFITAFASLHLLTRWVRTFSFTPFVLYRLVLGATLLYLA
ncbi:MAG: undecaprenyl-diphosphate phosphatase [Alphaproteobacteria bacterium GM7ARS4]|nr:undecaprenyl-diphosphate phosphatase [Alphaproteobacteria bacterium GM7ARS4]